MLGLQKIDVGKRDPDAINDAQMKQNSFVAYRY